MSWLVNGAWSVQISLIQITFLLEGAILWIEDMHFSRKQQIEIKNTLMMDLILTNTQLFTSQDIN